MKKLLLTSMGLSNPSFGNRFLELVEKDPQETYVLLVPNLIQTAEQLKYLEEAQQEIAELGIPKENIQLASLEEKVALEDFNTINAIYVCGGNTFYVLDKIRNNGLDRVLKKLVEQGVVYIGVSAGSILAGADTEIALPFDPNDVGIKDFSGLNLVPVVITPHFDPKEAVIIDEYEKKLPYPVVRLTDTQALLVINDEQEIIE